MGGEEGKRRRVAEGYKRATQLQAAIYAITHACFNKCMAAGAPGRALSQRESECLQNCTAAYLQVGRMIRDSPSV